MTGQTAEMMKRCRLDLRSLTVNLKRLRWWLNWRPVLLLQRRLSPKLESHSGRDWAPLLSR